MTIRLTRRSQFAIKEEATEGTAETLTASEVPADVEEIDATYEPEMNERNPLRSTLDRPIRVPGWKHGQITGRTEIVGGGATTTEPPWAEIIQACGFKEYTVYQASLTSVTGTPQAGEHFTDATTKEGRVVDYTGSTLTFVQVVGTFADTDSLTGTTSGFTGSISGAPTAQGFGYMPASAEADVPSFTAGAYLDGVRHLLQGCRGTGVIEIGGAGELAYLNFTLDGAAPTAPADVALLASVTYPNVVPEAFLSAGVTFDGDASCIDSFQLDLGNTVAARKCANNAAGVISYKITDRQPIITVDPEAQLEADIPFWTDYAAGTPLYFEALIGSTSTKRVSILVPNGQYVGMTNADRDGIRTYNVQLAAFKDQDDGDDSVILATW